MSVKAKSDYSQVVVVVQLTLLTLIKAGLFEGGGKIFKKFYYSQKFLVI